MADLKQFEKQQYLNLETFRKNGNGIKTPVWFAQEGEILFIWTETTTGKAKRVRNGGKVNIAPCKGNGSLLGEWIPATALADESAAAVEHVKTLMSKKYGFVFSLFGLMGKFRRSHYISIRVEPA